MGKAFLIQNFEKEDELQLYDFSSHIFTNAGIGGNSGPTLADVQNAYVSQDWAQNLDYLNMTYQGIQEWTVPKNGTYRIEAAGARGGNNSSGSDGGLGAKMRGDFSLLKGEILLIAVGQQGSDTGTSCGAVGGGGGSFVVKKSSSGLLTDNTIGDILVIAGAGGGGGRGGPGTGIGGVITQNGTPSNGGTGTGAGGVEGTGGGLSSSNCASPNGSGGAGFLTNGADSGGGVSQSFKNGLNGGQGRQGGFGGGGGAASSGYGGGGGGGFSGGGAGGLDGACTCGVMQGGGGGGSYNTGANQNNEADANNGDGYVSVTLL